MGQEVQTGSDLPGQGTIRGHGSSKYIGPKKILDPFREGMVLLAVLVQTGRWEPRTGPGMVLGTMVLLTMVYSTTDSNQKLAKKVLPKPGSGAHL